MGRGIRFTREFKREAVRLVLTSGRPRAEIAEDLGVGLSSLTRWIGQYRGEEMPPEIRDDLQAELKRLRKENAVLRQEPGPSCPSSGQRHLTHVNGFPNEDRSPKSGHRMAAEGMPFPWLWNGGTISLI